VTDTRKRASVQFARKQRPSVSIKSESKREKERGGERIARVHKSGNLHRARNIANSHESLPPPLSPWRGQGTLKLAARADEDLSPIYPIKLDPEVVLRPRRREPRQHITRRARASFASPSGRERETGNSGRADLA